MASPAPALLQLLEQLDALCPQRNRASDGIMGDAAHQARASDHNDGNALDITFDAQNGPDLEALAAVLMEDPRARYVIWRRRITNKEKDQPGAWRPYDGADAHEHHLHLSIYPEQRDDRSPWDLEQPAGPATTNSSAGQAWAALGVLTGMGVVAGVVVAISRAARPEPSTRWPPGSGHG